MIQPGHTTKRKTLMEKPSNQLIHWRGSSTSQTSQLTNSLKRKGAKQSTLVNVLLKDDGTQLITNEEKADTLFHKTCVATAACITQDITTPHDGKRLPEEGKTYLPPLSDELTTKAIEQAINSSPPIKARGSDDIQNWVWCASWSKVKGHILHLYRSIARIGAFPKRWKQAKTFMLPKPGKADYTMPGSYRPIALLNTISKVFEKLMASHMSTPAKKHQLLNEGHYGGRPHRSSQDALVHLVSWIKQQWSAGQKVAGIFADVKSAFPSVHHNCMLHTLEKLNYHPETTNLVFTFLTERTTKLAFNDFESEDFDLTHGLP